MQAFPHVYTVAVSAQPTGSMETRSDGKVSIAANAPAEFGGPGDQWSPEDLLVAAVADCYALSFRAVASASKLEWSNLEVAAAGTLDKVERITRFTEVEVTATLIVADEALREKAMRLLQKAEDICLVTNSMTATTHLHATVTIG